MKPDLTLLYSQLGLKPDCSLAELQLAYRRRISELQPNHLESGSQSPEASALLCNLIWLHTTASRFHRRYGRLPGASAQRPGSGDTPNVTVQRAYVAYQQLPSQEREGPPPRIALGFSFLLLILVFALLAWWGWLNV